MTLMDIQALQSNFEIPIPHPSPLLTYVSKISIARFTTQTVEEKYPSNPMVLNMRTLTFL